MTSGKETFPIKIEYLCFEVTEGQRRGRPNDNIKGCNVKECAWTFICRISESTVLTKHIQQIIYGDCNLRGS